jgi:hypothetical protein
MKVRLNRFLRLREEAMLRKIILMALMSLLAIAPGCGQQGGNNPLGVTAGGQNGYGGIGGNTSSESSIVAQLLGTWRNNINSQYYKQFKFNPDGSCEIWDYDVETNIHEIGSYIIRPGEVNNLTVESPHFYFEAPFYIDNGDLIFEGEGGNFVYHRVREKV